MTRTLSEGYYPSHEAVSLSHLLSRLQVNLLSPSADLKLLRRSKYHRARVAANIEYGRSLLLKIENSLPQIKSSSRKNAVQTELKDQRRLLQTLQQRINDLAVEGDMLVEDEYSSGDEDILPTPGDSTPGRPASCQGDGADDLQTIAKDEEDTGQGKDLHSPTQEKKEKPAVEESPKLPETTHHPQTTTSTLRSRHHQPLSSPTSHSTAIPGPSTTTSNQPSTSSLFPSTSPPTQPAHTPSPTSTNLTQSRHEQDTLTDSLLSLASQLKASSQTFQAHLESEKTIVDRAVEGIDRNTSGLDAAGKRMGALRRMTEGRGWWGRVMMYLWIFGLWVVAVLIVFVGPKLRF